MRIPCDTDEKQENRILIRNWIRKNYSRDELKSAKVLCLPGGSGVEVREIWDKLGVSHKNIWGVTNCLKEFEEMKSNVPNINIEYGDVTDLNVIVDISGRAYMKYNSEKDVNELFASIKNKETSVFPAFDIIYFDFYGCVSVKNLQACRFFHGLKNNGILGVSYYLQREKWENYKKMVSELNMSKIDAFFHMIINRGIYNMNTYENSDEDIMGWGGCEDFLGSDFAIKSSYYDDFRKTMDEWHEVQGENIELSADEVSKIPGTIHPGDVYKHIRRNGVYPVRFFKSTYHGNGNSLMGTAIAKFRKIKNIKPQRGLFKVVNKQCAKLYDTETFEVERISKGDEPIIINDPNLKSLIFKNKEFAILAIKHLGDKYLDVLPELTGFTRKQLLAYKAHITMGTY